MSLLSIRGLHVWFETKGRPTVRAVGGVDLALEPGDRFGLVGESGCGKTTTMLAVMGLLPANAVAAGEICLDGQDLLASGEEGFREHRWRDVAIVFQGTMNAFNPVRPVIAQIAEPLRVHSRLSDGAARSRAIGLLDSVGIGAAAGDRYPHELSGGMRQRAAIAMALACEPRILLADEPTTALDVMVQAQILELLVGLAEERGLALVLVTHDLAVVAQTCDRAAVMQSGRIIESGAVDALYHAPGHPYTAALFKASRGLPGPDEDAPAAARRPMDRSRAPLLKVAALHVHYPVRRSLAEAARGRPREIVRAVDDVALSVGRGEMVALVGESGCGKTSTALAAMRMAPIASGSISFDGHDIASLGPRAVRPLRRRFQMIYQDPYESLDPRFRVRDTVEEPLQVHRIGSAPERLERVLTSLTRAGLVPPEAYLDRYPHELSGGERQRVAIAASLVLGPELLIADEPVSMLDVSVRTGLLSLLRGLVDEGMAMVMITHDLSTAAHFADRIAVMYLGRIIEEGPAFEVATSPVHPYTRALLAAVPRRDPRDRARGRPLGGEAQDSIHIPAGCRFRPRCPVAEERCQKIDLELRPTGRSDEHRAACVLA